MSTPRSDEIITLLFNQPDHILLEFSYKMWWVARLQREDDLDLTIRKVETLLIDDDEDELYSFIDEIIEDEEYRVMELCGGFGSDRFLNSSLKDEVRFVQLYEKGNVDCPLDKKQRVDSLLAKGKECYDVFDLEGYRNAVKAAQVLCRWDEF